MWPEHIEEEGSGVTETARKQEILELQRKLEQNRILDLINDIWKANPDLSLAEILPDEKYDDQKLEKILKNILNYTI